MKRKRISGKRLTFDQVKKDVGDVDKGASAIHSKRFSDRERRWRECGERLPEVIPAVQHLREKSESSRAASLTRVSFATAWRIGELEIALRIVQQQVNIALHDLVMHQAVDDIGAFPLGRAEDVGVPQQVTLDNE